MAHAPQYRYMVFLTLITAQAVILCQYVPDAPPGYTGQVLAHLSPVF